MKKILVVLFSVFLLTACTVPVHVQEQYPNVSFLNQEQVEKFLPGKVLETSNKVLTFLDNGVLDIYDKKHNRELGGWWKVDDKGKIKLYLGKKIRSGYITDKNMLYLTLYGNTREFTK